MYWGKMRRVFMNSLYLMLKDPSESRGHIMHSATAAMQRMSKMQPSPPFAWPEQKIN